MKRVLIIGCGDVGLRVASLLKRNYKLLGLVRDQRRFPMLRAAGIIPLAGNLDDRASLSRLSGMADIVLHFAPPPDSGARDQRTQHLLSVLSRGALPGHILYISTSGVYGDCAGAWVNETRPLAPQSLRAQRRVDAETQIRAWAQRHGVDANILRVPGIYAADRLPLSRLQQGMPAIIAEQDSYTNHIHADDLARIVVATLRRGKPNRVYHTSDDSESKMGAYFDEVADAYHLPRPPRLPRAEVQRAVSPMMWSFMQESRRLTNTRMKNELKVLLRYPQVQTALMQVLKP